MRELKFNFVYGIDGETTTYFTKSFDFGEIENGCHWDEIADNPLLKEYSIVGKRQYTGLKDKNGASIYEGDIVITHTGHVGLEADFGKSRYRVQWRDKGACFDMMHQDYLDHKRQVGTTFDNGGVFSVEVIGNIYQHPELLEGGDK